MNVSTYKTPSISGAVPRPSNSTHVHIAVASPNLHFSLLRQGHTEAQYRGESTDLTLVSQDGGELHVHRCVILPLSPLLTSLAKEQVWCCAQPRVVLAEETLETLTAMVSLIYTGTCRLDTTTTQLVQEALHSLAINIPQCHLQREDVQYKLREHQHTSNESVSLDKQIKTKSSSIVLNNVQEVKIVEGISTVPLQEKCNVPQGVPLHLTQEYRTCYPALSNEKDINHEE